MTDPMDLDLLLARARTLLDFKAYLDSCKEAAFTDYLTALPNRRRFELQLEREVARTLRYEHPFSLLLLDIDHFKEVNDTHGHEAGDEAIRRVAKTLQEGTRGIDLAARIGGEEFGVILSETRLEGAIDLAERLRVAIKEVRFASIGEITASFGVAECPSCGQTERELLASADAALYQAKREGRDRVRRAQAEEPNSATVGDVH
jgi:diguanylate cyclase (GGDEF)-like protein